jgi:hypothetical protein
MNIATLIVSIITGLGGFIIGYWRGRSAQRALDLSLTKAAPKIGTAIRIDKRQENPSTYPPFYYLVVAIYNEGGLPAKQVKGNCRVYSATKNVKERSVPIERDFLGISSPSELELCRLEDGVSGMTVNLGGRGAENIRFNVDIDFSYFGIEDDTPEQYHAHYEYDYKNQQVRRKEQGSGNGEAAQK